MSATLPPPPSLASHLQAQLAQIRSLDHDTLFLSANPAFREMIEKIASSESEITWLKASLEAKEEIIKQLKLALASGNSTSKDQVSESLKTTNSQHGLASNPAPKRRRGEVEEDTDSDGEDGPERQFQSCLSDVTWPDRKSPKYAGYSIWTRAEWKTYKSEHGGDKSYSKFNFITTSSGKPKPPAERKYLNSEARKIYIDAYHLGLDADVWRNRTSDLEEMVVNRLCKHSVELAVGGGWKAVEFMGLHWSDLVGNVRPTLGERKNYNGPPRPEYQPKKRKRRTQASKETTTQASEEAAAQAREEAATRAREEAATRAREEEAATRAREE
ncbi:hypothetical protein EST38_g13915, partial [Candolleomyces aberdarensis]